MRGNTMQIEKRIPYTSTKRRLGRPSKYPFRELSKGDSFFVPLPEGKTIRYLRHLIASNVSAANRNIEGAQFDYASGKDGVRVWRIS